MWRLCGNSFSKRCAIRQISIFSWRCFQPIQPPMPDIQIKQLFSDSYLSRTFECGDDPHAEAALPRSSLEFLLEVSRRIGAKRIFEFGSGRSTQALLTGGYRVFSLEDSAFWMSKSLETLQPDERSRHKGSVSALRTKMHGGFPVLDWVLDDSVKREMGLVDLILVDSPHFTPFRESTLWASLQYGSQALVILDDTRIPTLQSFCDRISSQNPQLLHRRISVGHGFDLFHRGNSGRTLHRKQSIVDMLKGWRRYFKGRAFYAELSRRAEGNS
jgi:hypothetical protein